MTSEAVIAALAKKHSDAVFVPECKNGPTQTGSHRRFDAWVLLKTWSPVTTIGYEVKVSRSDWRRDEKLADYMGLCHLLYLAAPKGVVPIEELPTGVGLMELVGERFITRRKATRREIEMPVSLMVYVLMCRAKVTRDDYEKTREHWRTDQLRAWVEGRDERQKLSYAVSRKIHDAFHEQERETERTRERIRQLEQIEARMRELGFDPTRSIDGWRVTERLNQLSGAVNAGLLRSMECVEQELNQTRLRLQAIKADAAVEQEIE